MIEIDFQYEGLRFGISLLGTITYFMCVKYKFLNFELDNPEDNSNAILDNKVAMGFFCIIGGLIPILMDIRLLLGCFVQGFILRATLSSFYAGNKKKISGLERADTGDT